MEKSEKARVVRQYRKSSLPRLRWTSRLHDHFVQAVHNLGGKYEATPKRIMQVMGVKGLNVSHIKSHLQMYRSMKEPTDLKGFSSVNNYQQHKTIGNNWFRQRPVCIGLKEVPPHDHTSQGKRTTEQNGEHIFLHNINRKDTQSSAWEIPTKDYHDFLRANVEAQAIGSNQVSQSSKHSRINLDLTM